MVSDFAETLRKMLRTRMNDYADALAGGGAQSFEAYKEMVGTITGLALAERDLLDLLKKTENDDDE